MKNIISLLDKIGSSAELKQLDGDALAKVLNPMDLDEELQAAILMRDNSALEMILDARNKIVCIICPAEEPTKEPSEDEEEQEDNEEKSLVSNGW